MKNNNYSKFILLWIGELISAIGSGLTSFGLSVYVFGQTGSAASTSLVALFGFLPTLLLSVPAGVLADKFDRRILMMIGDGCSAVGVAYILICMMNGGAALWQICLGVFISSAFSALLEPSYRATITDLLTKEQFSKASGMISIAGSARYLVSPIAAGLLLSVSDIKLLLILDILTLIPTVIAAAVVRKAAENNTSGNTSVSFMKSLKEGAAALTEKKGVVVLVAVSSVMTCFMGAIQILSEPMILSFSDSAVLGTAETICACGMVVSGIALGRGILKKNYSMVLGISLAVAGAAMVGFGLVENIFIVCIFGFLFFAMLPFANSCLDYLVRTNIRDEHQGRVWGLIGFLSQIGYVTAYAVGGDVADCVADYLNISVGRGAAIVIIAAGVMLFVCAVAVCFIKSVKALEDTAYEPKNDT